MRLDISRCNRAFSGLFRRFSGGGCLPANAQIDPAFAGLPVWFQLGQQILRIAHLGLCSFKGEHAPVHVDRQLAEKCAADFGAWLLMDSAGRAAKMGAGQLDHFNRGGLFKRNYVHADRADEIRLSLGQIGVIEYRTGTTQAAIDAKLACLFLIVDHG